IISALEDHPYKPTIAKDLNRSPFFNELMCGVEHGPDMDPTLKKALENAATSNKASKKLISILAESPKRKSLLTTSQAIDIVSGGVKVNALPEVATAIGNYRIHIDESVKSTEERVLGIVSTVAKKFNLTVEQRTASGDVFFVGVDGQRVQNAAAAAPSLGLVSIVTLDDSLEPAPITPTTGKPFQLVAGTIRQAMVRGDEKLFVAPSLPTGNSDTRYFHSLSKHIFRFTALRDHDSHNIHTVDEKCKIDDLVQSAGFFFQLLRNVDQD
ncbi:hypothetical protein HDU99_006743, partial [Rhizoclosmatium hyalinum]